MSKLRDSWTFDGEGNPINSYDGSLDVHQRYEHNTIVNRRAHQHTAVITTITTDAAGDGTVYTLDVADATGFAVGDFVHINTTTEETTHPKITAISAATGPSTFTLDRRLDKAHFIGDSIEKAILDIALQVATMASPQEYWIEPPAGQIWYITRLLFAMSHDTAGDLGKFGGIPALTNGLTVRSKVNNVYRTFANWRTNADIKSNFYDVDFDIRSGGGGVYGTSGRGTFTAAGITIKLNGDDGDKLEVYAQDDITGLNEFYMTFQGYYEDIV